MVPVDSSVQKLKKTNTRYSSGSVVVLIPVGQDTNGSGSFHSDSSDLIVHTILRNTAHPVNSQACIETRNPSCNAVLFAVPSPKYL